MGMVDTEKRKSCKKQSTGKALCGFFTLKRGGNKKGFTLVELLIAITVLAILLPALVRIFVLSSQLNLKSSLQGRADHLAEATMEEIKKVDVDKLEEWLSANGWSDKKDAVDPVLYSYIKTSSDNKTDFTFKLSKYLDNSGNEKYRAGVPKFPGTNTDDINLTDKQLMNNEQNNLAVSEMLSRLTVNEELKEKIWQSIKNTVYEDDPQHVFDPGRMTLTGDGTAITADDLIKKATITITYTSGKDKIKARYNVDFIYNLVKCNYQYLYYDVNNRFKTITGLYTPSDPVEITENFSKGEIEKDYKGQYPAMQDMFISYTPLNEKDKITIEPPTDNNINLIFEENYRTNSNTHVLKKTSFEGCEFKDYVDATRVAVILKNKTSTNYVFFSSNNSALDAPLSESTYQDEVKTWVYQVEVSVVVKETPTSNRKAEAYFVSTMFR